MPPPLPQARVAELQADVAAAQKEAAAARIEAATSRAELHQAQAAMGAAHAELALSQAATKLVAEERGELAAKVASLARELAQCESSFAERSRLVEELTEALQLQKETVATAKRLGAVRDAELSKALRGAEELAAGLRRQMAAGEEAAKFQVAALLKVQKEQRLELTSATAQIAALESENEALKAAVAKVEALEQDKEQLRAAMMRMEVLERANVELCAQVAQAQAERRAAAARETTLRSHRLAGDAAEEAVLRQKVTLGGGRAWVALVACALALVWSSAAGRAVDGGHSFRG